MCRAPAGGIPKAPAAQSKAEKKRNNVKKMKRQQLFLLWAKAALATMFGSSWLFKQAKAQTPGPGAGAESQTRESLERCETLGANESV